MPDKYENSSGFTLVELAISVVILGILLSAALPSFVTFLRNTEVRSAAESTLQGLQLAKAEAVRRNERVRVIFGTDTGWSVTTDSGTSIQSKPAKEGSPNSTLTFTPTAARRVTFNSFGRVTTNSDTTAAITQIDFAATGKTVSRSITISSGGQLHLCDPNITSTTDPRRC